MVKNLLVAAVIVCAAGNAWSAEPASTNSTKPANCRDSAAEARKACEQANARKQLASEPAQHSPSQSAIAQQPEAESSSSSSPHDPQAVMHSSPIMQTAEERAAEKALREGKDPREAVKEVQRQSKAN
jgi:hypothetical protein